jgi:ABC-type transport system substrate-binding protein
MNIVKNVGDYLKNLGIQFSVEKVESNVVLFELYTIDVSSYVQIESNGGKFNAFLYIRLDDDILYDIDWEEGGSTSIEEEIDNLIDEANKLGEVVSEVSRKLREIIKICDENDINYEKFIAINYGMKKF